MHSTPRLILISALALPLFAAPALAQSTTTTSTTTSTSAMTTDPETGKAITQQRAAADAAEKPVTSSLNNQVTAQQAGTDAQNAANQAQYESDMAAYRAKLAAGEHKEIRDQARYLHQQHAYADAMADWRIQNAQCQRGVLKACKRPAPDPADYY
jgi:uncharacterized membrane protein